MIICMATHTHTQKKNVDKPRIKARAQHPHAHTHSHRIKCVLCLFIPFFSLCIYSNGIRHSLNLIYCIPSTYAHANQKFRSFQEMISHMNCVVYCVFSTKTSTALAGGEKIRHTHTHTNQQQHICKTMLGYVLYIDKHAQKERLTKIDCDARLKWNESNKNVIWR